MAKERMKYVYETILPAIRKTGKFTRDVINARMAAPSLPQPIVRPLLESTGRAFKKWLCNASCFPCPRTRTAQSSSAGASSCPTEM
ncbi:Ld-bro-h [Lymantria dispar multiple nucleopolyhedrovirus]|uniref:Ld-bro-h n=1 Tax=Lymantria dispar multicapsid nuclear polyhedrosis virus TaxID=10449 RepID=Q9YML5_NPVLD|nr:Ld-bro-h [Lymantria dispar multiple nucleopolyhedrovirus]AAC70298.1 Ld-bro-h [Lymantria dispar multiple nucleopolyhedrovirus]